MKPFSKKSLAIATAGVFLLYGCATTQPPPSSLPDLPQLDKLMKAGECNSATAALIGGLLGTMIADDDRMKGAAIGAGIGALACYIINAQSKQTRPQVEVDEQYRADHQGMLPEQALVTVYDTAFNAGGSVTVGKEARVVSSITLVSGSKDPVRDVVEVLEVFESGDPTKVLLRAEKKAEKGMLSGGLQNIFNIRLPDGLAAGSYPASTKLYLNGKLAGENRGALRMSGPN